MSTSDVVVIGGGFAGLMAALVSAGQGKSVTLLTYGSGTFPLNSGLIDVFGYGASSEPIKNPWQALQEAPAEHPYRKIGADHVKSAVHFFQELSAKEGIPYVGSLEEQQWVPTAVGTLKPTCLVPESMQGKICQEAASFILVGIQGLKDFYVDFFAENIKEWLGEDKQYTAVSLHPDLPAGRDLTTLDVARWLDTEAGRKSFIEQLKPHAAAQHVFLLPQVLGTRSSQVYQEVKDALGCELVEVTSMPPSPNGLRLREMLMRALRKTKVHLVENAKVTSAVCEGTGCQSVTTESAGRTKTYHAKKFILATGGFYGGGLVMQGPGVARETIFNLPVDMMYTEESWSNQDLFSAEKQNFAKAGIRTDESLRPVDPEGHCLLDNVYITGRNLSGYDFCFEQSGNGIALSSAYKAAMA